MSDPDAAAPADGFGLEPVDRRRLADRAYDAVRLGIVEGRFPMGHQLREIQLAAALGMSRGPVREALRRLSEEGLLEEEPHRGVRVREVSARDIVDLYNVRIALETTAIRLLIRNGVSTEPLRRVIDEQAEAARRGSSHIVARTGLEFHRTLCELSGNVVLAQVFRSLEAQVMMAISIGDARAPALLEPVQGHRRLVERIEAGDERGAVGELADIVATALGRILEALGGDPRQLLTPLSAVAVDAGQEGAP